MAAHSVKGQLTPRRRHEVRDESGRLIAVLDIIDQAHGSGPKHTVELAADIGGTSYRLRLFAPAIEKLAAA
jgi:hypothetical protein